MTAGRLLELKPPLSQRRGMLSRQLPATVSGKLQRWSAGVK
eukprot:CAMPEP_0179061580 /NCGR_PEP_ID=MMETSP0796-20121207/26479_1 /TAXON_ID=73915 /ORGANISM="Pyrodinium bahamense, Strain pbaha01" /LENGTH=40 /DNA_ID= /DNA_START= /DNA_END= /DNA_ORIENTATION=